MKRNIRRKGANRRERWDAPQERHFEVPPKDAWLTHLGDKSQPTGFRELPRWDHESRGHVRIETAMSMLEGRLNVDEATFAVRRTSIRRSQVSVRRFLAGDLMDAGYWTFRTPTTHLPNHVSVFGNMEEITAAAGASDYRSVMNDVDANLHWWNNPQRVPLEDLAKEVDTS